MATVKLKAKERFYYNGRNREKDEEFDALEQDVKLLTWPHPPKAVVVPPPDPPPLGAPEQQPKAKIPEGLHPARSYRRRDMKAED